MKLYNTLTRKTEDFKPLTDKKVNFFVCGPTVYDLSHMGHAKTYIQMDILARTLHASGYDVFYLQNITDIDDKIIARAKEKNISWEELRSTYEAEYLKDMETLNIGSVSQYARATDYITDIIRQVQTLLDKGHAYTIDDGIYFEIASFTEYGKLSGRTQVQENDAQTRIDQSEGKRGWNDSCLWKFSKPGEPVWDAPFGKGRPGWHIEDTAITEHFFGPQYDIHGGAVDLIFPHHEAEITQMEAASGKKPFVKYWTHVGFLNINDDKMSKSKGNFFTIREVFEKGYDPKVIRLFMLQSHYRSTINFSWDLLDAAHRRLQGLWAMIDLRWQPNEHGQPAEVWEALRSPILQALQSDLDTPRVLALLNDLATKLEMTGIHPASQAAFADFLNWLDELLGLNFAGRPDISEHQKSLISQRQTAREAKDWEKSDQLRDELQKHDIGVRDTDHGPIWYRKS